MLHPCPPHRCPHAAAPSGPRVGTEQPTAVPENTPTYPAAPSSAPAPAQPQRVPRPRSRADTVPRGIPRRETAQGAAAGTEREERQRGRREHREHPPAASRPGHRPRTAPPSPPGTHPDTPPQPPVPTRYPRSPAPAALTPLRRLHPAAGAGRPPDGPALRGWARFGPVRFGTARLGSARQGPAPRAWERGGRQHASGGGPAVQRGAERGRRGAAKTRRWIFPGNQSGRRRRRRRKDGSGAALPPPPGAPRPPAPVRLSRAGRGNPRGCARGRAAARRGGPSHPRAFLPGPPFALPRSPEGLSLPPPQCRQQPPSRRGPRARRCNLLIIIITARAGEKCSGTMGR